MTAGLRFDSAVARAALTATDLVHGRRLSVLIFHRVRAAPDPLFPDEVDAGRFEQLLRMLGQSCHVLDLSVALDALDQGSLPPRAVSITFDDGYADNEAVALPLLQRAGMSASFFIATDFLDGGRMWNDTVIETVRACRKDELDLRALQLGRLPLRTLEERRAAIHRMLAALKHRDRSTREELVRLVLAAGGAQDLPNDLMMSSRQLVNLHRRGMNIGGHTCGHPILRMESDSAAMAQIVQGRERLQRLLDTEIAHFAYPNGRPGDDFDARHVAMVRAAGFKAAVSTAPGVVTSSSCRFELPRFTPWDRSRPRWAMRLAWNRLRSGRVDAVAPGAAAA